MRIVIVEDEMLIRNGMGKLLQRLNPDYELVGKASDGLEGLEVIRKEKPDLVIMDIMMPAMDGLTMLRTLREEGNTCRAIVLSAYSDFTYAKEAIELGIESYLLKPIKISELENALLLISNHLEKEQKEKQRYTLDKILKAGLSSTFHEDEAIQDALEAEYGFDSNGEMGLFMIWLGDSYRDYAEGAEESLKHIGSHNIKFGVCVVKSRERRQLVAVLYGMESVEAVKNYLKKTIAPMVASQTNRKAVMGFRCCCGIGEMSQAALGLYKVLDYRLVIGEEQLVVYEEMQTRNTIPFQYPAELESRSRQAVVNRDSVELKKCMDTFLEACRKSVIESNSGKHSAGGNSIGETGIIHPKEIKEACIRFGYALINAAKDYGKLTNGEMSMHSFLKSVSGVVSWEQIDEVFKEFFMMLMEEKETGEDTSTSLLVRRAAAMIREYYSQGITLEEIARKLYVTEEYLSAQFKKETGTTFSDTIRKVRVEKIKELLLSTDLKLNQIARQAGYADPKYMSKVFREETGMLPLEYRKMNF